ncbi:uncharacterized protein LOC135947864 [Cloeon dipterum]|uniref:uncharacterized protein LOC135947864 n=1 Tax=Cloeon dipterum TaxID=197152 RepID=UPI00321FDFB6
MNQSSGKLELKTADCEQEQQFMCSAYHKHHTRAVQIWWDCLKSFGLKTDDEDALLNVFGPPPSSTLLCYGRCMGQKYQKILDNTVNTQSVLRYLEDQIKDEKVLQDAYKLVEQCIHFNETRLCEFTYLVLKCIMTNAYQLVQGLMANAISNSVMIPPPIMCLPNYHFCNETSDCVVNNSLTIQLTASGKTDIGDLVTLPSNKAYFIGKRLPLNFLYQDAKSYCCSVGKRLLELESAKELQEIFLFDTSITAFNRTVIGPMAEDGNGDLVAWCSSGAPIPKELFPNATVPKNPCFKISNCPFLNIQNKSVPPVATIAYYDCLTTVPFFICE